MTKRLELPTDVVDIDWKKYIGYETYKREKTYVLPKNVKVTKRTITRIKKLPIKLSIKGLWEWEEDTKKIPA